MPTSSFFTPKDAVMLTLEVVNTQPAEKPNHRADGSLEVHSVFKTIQGEGPLTGTPAVFVRLAGCNLGEATCPRCDTNYTSHRVVLSVENLLAQVTLFAVRGGPVRLLVLTGGEPFRQNLTPFIQAAVRAEYDVQVETNGTLWLEDFPSDDEVTVVCSPKTPKLHKELVRRTDAFKYILQAGQVLAADGLPRTSMGAELAIARPPAFADVFVQPLDEGDPVKNAANARACVDSCLKHGYRLSLQQHKYLGLD